MAETLFSPGISTAETDQSAIAAGTPIAAGAAIVGPTVKGPVLVPTKVTSYSQYVGTFGTTFLGKDANNTGSAVQQEFMTSLAAKAYFEQGGESLLVVRAADPEAFSPAKSTFISASSGSVNVFTLYSLGEGQIFNSNDGNGNTYTTGSGGTLVSGSSNNFRFDIDNVNNDAGTFTLVIRRGDDDDNNKVILETWNNLSLDPYSSNYIAAVIGDQYTKFVDAVYNGEEAHLEVHGDYANKSNYVRVEVHTITPNYVSANSGSLPKEQGGAFYSGSGKVGVPYSGGSEQSSSYDNVAYFQDIEDTTKYPQSVSPSDYQKGIELLSNADEYEINVLSVPGLFMNSSGSGALGVAVSICSDRGDCIAVVDPVTYDTSKATVPTTAATINSSYAAAYWPWLQTYSSTGRAVWVPASVIIPGVYAYNDKQTAPWYAPAGMSRGGISAVQASRKLTKSDRDLLYAKNINPIATLPGTGLVIYGQKTLQKKSSALDRVNVRRLMIEVKKKVRDLASSLLFEQNNAALQNSFRSKLDPYLASVVQRNGLYNYAIDLSGNTSEAIDRNEFHCSIALQPTRTVEFVYINFTISATGVEFA